LKAASLSWPSLSQAWLICQMHVHRPVPEPQEIRDVQTKTSFPRICDLLGRHTVTPMALGAGEAPDTCLELTAANGTKSSFTFDKVFGPSATQVCASAALCCPAPEESSRSLANEASDCNLFRHHRVHGWVQHACSRLLSRGVEPCVTVDGRRRRCLRKSHSWYRAP
jgi:hypothetical protein